MNSELKLDENLIAENVQQLIELLGVPATAEVSFQEQTFYVDISSPDSSLLIGKFGANLEALQFALAVRLKTQTGDEEFELFVDVDGWRRQREEKLKNMASQIAEKVTSSGQPEPIYNLKASERRVIHTALTDHPDVATESVGEGEERYLIIKPKQK